MAIDEKLTLLKGEKALVTGATRGIGKSIADEFAKAGAMVIGTATTKEGAEKISNRFSNADLDGYGIVLVYNYDACRSGNLQIRNSCLWWIWCVDIFHYGDHFSIIA